MVFLGEIEGQSGHQTFEDICLNLRTSGVWCFHPFDARGQQWQTYRISCGAGNSDPVGRRRDQAKNSEKNEIQQEHINAVRDPWVTPRWPISQGSKLDGICVPEIFPDHLQYADCHCFPKVGGSQVQIPMT